MGKTNMGNRLKGKIMGTLQQVSLKDGPSATISSEVIGVPVKYFFTTSSQKVYCFLPTKNQANRTVN